MSNIFPPTLEQQAILSAVTDSKDNLMITAFAGTGKTSTLTMIANQVPMQPALALAFNVQIKKELERRFPPFFKIMTLNGLGHLAWMRAIPRDKKINLDERKLGRLVTAIFKEHAYSGAEDAWTNVRTLVSKAMQVGIVPASRPNKPLVPDTPEQWAMLAEDLWLQDIGEPEIDMARKILSRSVDEGFEGIISFDDQIYLPCLFNGAFPRFGLVLVDEAQDLSPLNHIMISRSSSGRLIVVGDPKQAIYKFRGADSESMSKLRKLRQNWIDLPLATTFRCPKIVVDRQAMHAPGFVAFSTNAIGEFKKLSRYSTEGKSTTEIGDDILYSQQEYGVNAKALNDMPKTWNWKTIESMVSHGSIAVLCRNNAPLLKIAFKLLRNGNAPTMLGRDIGKTLVAISKKVLPDDDLPAAECVVAINSWKDNQVALAQANQQENKVDSIMDQAECLLAVIEGSDAKDAAAIRWYLRELFERSAGHVVISSIHRAKGLEYDTVLHLDPWRIPSKFAMNHPAQLQQEMNLRYVVETRTKRLLIEANLEDFE